MNIKNYNHVTINSKNVKEGSIFVSVDSNMQYINEAIKNKASLIITKRLVQCRLRQGLRRLQNNCGNRDRRKNNYSKNDL